MLQSLSDFLVSIETLLSHLEYEKNSQLYFQHGIKKHTGNSSFEVEFRSFVRDKISPSLISSKTYSYQNAIISLYGYLERFIEDVIVEYLRSICEICSDYKALPSAIRKNHFNSSLELINKTQRLKGLTVEQRNNELKNAVKNMHSCLQENSEFTINFQAFVNHSSNFRYDSIHEIFSRIGIAGFSRSCLRNKEFVRALSEKYYIDSILDTKILISLLIAELDDLAQRRNEIAHGARIDDLESIELLVARIKLIRAFGVAIHDVVNTYMNEYLYTACKKVDLKKPARAFPNLRVLGFEGFFSEHVLNVAETLKVGDLLFAVNEDSNQKLVSGKITSLRIGNKEVDSILLPCNTAFAIGVDFEFNSHITKRTIYTVHCP